MSERKCLTERTMMNMLREALKNKLINELKATGDILAQDGKVEEGH